MKVLIQLYSVVFIPLFCFSVLVTPCIGAEVVSFDRHLVRYDNGVIYDRDSALEWFAAPDRGMNWDDAKRWVTELDEDGGGWRMPTRRELKTLHHVGDGVSNVTRLLVTSGYWLWAGPTKASSSRWIFRFSYGGEGWIGLAPADGGRAIAVRIRKKY